MKPSCGSLGRFSPDLFTFSQALDVFPVVAALPRPANDRLGPQLTAARIRVQRGPRDPEGVRGLLCREEVAVCGHDILIIESILTSYIDTAKHERMTTE